MVTRAEFDDMVPRRNTYRALLNESIDGVGGMNIVADNIEIAARAARRIILNAPEFEDRSHETEVVSLELTDWAYMG